MVKGPLTVTDMVCWHAGMGMGLYGVRAAAARLPEPQAHPALLPPRPAERPRRHAAGALGPGVRAPFRQPHHVRLRPHARDLAHPPLHRLDGRRRLAVEARLRVPPLQLRRRHAVAARPGRAQVPRRRRPARGRPRARGREPARRGDDARATPRSCCRAASTGRCACPIRPAARAICRARSTRSRRSSRGDDRLVRYRSVDGLARRVRRGRAAPHARPARQAQRDRRRDDRSALDRRDRRGARPTTTCGSIVLDGAGDHFCGGADIVARNRDRDDASPAPAASSAGCRRRRTGSIPLLLRGAGARSCARCGAGRPASASSSRSRPTSPSPPTTPRFWEPFTERGFTPDSGATWLLPRRVGEVRARELLLLGRELSRRRGRGVGRDPRARFRRPSSTPRSTSSSTPARGGPTVALGLDEVAAARGQRRRARPAPAQRGVRARAVVAQRRLPRGHGRVPREARAPNFEGH